MLVRRSATPKTACPLFAGHLYLPVTHGSFACGTPTFMSIGSCVSAGHTGAGGNADVLVSTES